MSEDDKKAVFHILQLAEQGRFEEVVAQMIASLIHSGEYGGSLVDALKTKIQRRVVDLLLDPAEIWEGLLPGGASSYNPEEFVIVSGEEWARLQALEQRPEPDEENERFSADILLIGEHPGGAWLVYCLDSDDHQEDVGQHFSWKNNLLFRHVSHPDWDRLQEGMTIEVKRSDLIPLATEEVASWLWDAR